MKIGFAGLGRMGQAMAANLSDNHCDLVLWNRSPDKAADFCQQHGGDLASTPAELSRQCDIVFTMLADDEASTEVHLGADGLFAGLADREDNAALPVFVVMGTHSLNHINQLINYDSRVLVVDAPVSGATMAAEAAQLLFMVGASSDNTERLEPFLNLMGRKVIALGSPGAGCVMKLSVNLLIHGFNQALAESLLLSELYGIHKNDAFEVISNSAAAAPSILYRKDLYLNELSQPVSFTVDLAHKDMTLITELAANFNTRLPLSDATLEQLDSARNSGYGKRDMASIVSFLSGE